MKRIMGLTLVFLAVFFTAAGCADAPAPAAPTATASTTARFESYVTQTSFRFPKSWEYQSDEDIDEGMTALFVFDGGQAAVQFLWMDEDQMQRNVFLQQLEMDDAMMQPYTAGAYTGTLISGTNGDVHTVAFEGSRGWYGQTPDLYVRVVLEAQGAQRFEQEQDHLMDLLDSISVIEDQDPPAVGADKLETYDFVEDFGLKLTAPNSWWLTPDYDFEHGLIDLEFEVAAGGNIYRVETGTLTQRDYDAMAQSLADLKNDADVYDYARSEQNGEIQVTCLQEGKINRVRLTYKETQEGIRYLWVSSALRPVLDEAYYQDVVVPSINSIDWK